MKILDSPAAVSSLQLQDAQPKPLCTAIGAWEGEGIRNKSEDLPNHKQLSYRWHPTDNALEERAVIYEKTKNGTVPHIISLCLHNAGFRSFCR